MAWPLDNLGPYSEHVIKAAAQGGMDEYIKQMMDQATRRSSLQSAAVTAAIGLTALGATWVAARRDKNRRRGRCHGSRHTPRATGRPP